MQSKPEDSVVPVAEHQSAAAERAIDQQTGGQKAGPLIAGLKIPAFLIVAAVVIIGMATDVISPNILVFFTMTLTLGGVLHWIGGRVPVLRDFGLPIILCLVVPALMVHFGLLPTPTIDMFSQFYRDLGLIDFIVVPVIAGAIAGLSRKMLIKILARFAVPLIGTVVLTFTVLGTIGALIGYGFVKTILLVTAPVLAGGLPLGALPMSEMYADQTGVPADHYLSGLMSAVVLANTLCILIAAILNGMGKRAGKRFVGFNGEGQLLRVSGNESELAELAVAGKSTGASFTVLGKGLLLCGAILLVGMILGEVLPFLHHFAWIVVLLAVAKIFALFPADWDDAISQWGDFVVETFIPAFLVALSVAIIDINAIVDAISDPQFVILVAATVIVAGVISGVLGWLVKFYLIEASITTGLIMADMGGSGDVAVLSAANRMDLMPFAAVATRFGGTLVLFITTLLIPFMTPAMA